MLTGVIIHVVSLGFTLGYSGVKCGTGTGQAVGVYLETPSFTEIYVCDIGDGNTEATKQHELGHFVFKKSTKEQKEAYKKLYDKHKIIGLKAFSSVYSMSSVDEDFAETYSMVQLNKVPKNRLHKIRYNFIKSLGVR